MSDTLQHYGVKGMKWGVRRDKPSRIRQRFASRKRERSWKKVLRNVDKMSTKEIDTVARRISMENDLKTLSRSRIGTRKDKADYLRRASMSDQELSRKVNRLRAKSKLHRSVKDATKEQTAFGREVVRLIAQLRSES